MTRRSFTLIELLTVIAIIVLLVGIGLPVYVGIRRKAKKVTTRADMKQLETAISAYQGSYDVLPWTLATGGTSDYLLNDTDGDGDIDAPDNDYSDLLNCLSGTDNTLNPRNQSWLDLQTGNVYNDAWGNEFMIALDLDYDNDVDDAFIWGRAGQAREVIIWSMGPDGQQSDTDGDAENNDNIYAWEN